MLYNGTINKSPCHFSQSRETLLKLGAVGISPVFNNTGLPVSIQVHHNNGKPYMTVELQGGNK